MLNQRTFEQQFEADWVQLNDSLNSLESSKPWAKKDIDNSSLPTLYAALCQQHALAISRGYSPALTNRLHELITRAHHQLYKHRGHVLQRITQFFGGGFPRALREQKTLFAISCLLFFGTSFIFGALAAYSTDLADLFMGSKQRFALEYMYGPESDSFRPEGKEESTNLYMFGFYIMNNIGIDFRVFASGILFCVGSIFFMVFNGIHIGAAAGHLTSIGYNDKFWGFVAGHSAPELIALCVSGTAGLMLGMALIKPGRQTRRLALMRAAKKSVPLIVGAGLMTLLAAFIEAYWSSKDLSLGIKLAVGAIIWILIVAYLTLAGRTSIKHV